MAQTPPAITETTTTITAPFPHQEAIINNTPITDLPPTHLKEWHTNLQQETEQNNQLQKTSQHSP
jgi:hypothetical protein